MTHDDLATHLDGDPDQGAADRDPALDGRLAAIEARVPVESTLSAPAAPTRRRRFALATVAAPALVLVIGATALAGAAVIRMVTVGGGSELRSPVADAGLECMTPPQAAAWLAAHGYDDVAWDTSAGHGTIATGDLVPAGDLPDITDGLPTAPPDGATPGGPGAVPAPPVGTRSATPPAAGVVVPGPVIDGQLVMFVDVTPGATRPPTCQAAP